MESLKFSENLILIKIINVFIIVLLAIFLYKIVTLLTEKGIKKILKKVEIKKIEDEKRLQTILAISKKIFGIIIWILTLMLILDNFGIAIGPFLTGLGIVGIAVGLGSQFIIRDIISGIFIIFENQYRIGDIIEISGVTGTVENITIRKTVLRDINGSLHHIPHSEIKKVTNFTKDFTRINLNIAVPAGSNIDKVINTINKVGEEFSKDEKFKDEIITPPSFFRIEGYDEKNIVIKIIGRVKFERQRIITTELIKKINIAFKKEKIEIIYPRVAIK